MQWYLGPEGDQRIWYESDEIEQIAADELRRAGLMPTPAAPETDLEQFIEVHLKAHLDQYADLPEGVLGLTDFPARGTPKVSISAALTEAADRDDPTPGSVGRWRATLAHEASHIYLHRYLFDPEMVQLYGTTSGYVDATRTDTLLRCLHRDVAPLAKNDMNVTRHRGDWREIQANRGMAALLMPSRTFKRVAFQQMTRLGLSVVGPGSPAADELATAIAAAFAVSRRAATIRLRTEGVISES
jgi:hypothetical protein